MNRDGLAAFAQPDSLLPAQYLEIYRRKEHLEPEKRLMFAVLDDALSRFQKFVRTRTAYGRSEFQEIEQWILEEDSDWLFSFNQICEVLGIDPQWLRRNLIHWKRKEYGLGARHEKPARDLFSTQRP